MVKPMVMVALHKFMRDHYTMENGTWIKCMEKENFNGILEPANTRVNSIMDKELAMVFTRKVMKHTLDRLKTVSSMVKGDMYSTTPNQEKSKSKQFMKVSSEIIRLLEDQRSSVMDLFITESSKIIIYMEEEAFNILTALFMSEHSRIMRSMEWEHCLTQKIN